MSGIDQKTIIKNLLQQYGITFARELGIKLESGSPQALFNPDCAIGFENRDAKDRYFC